MTSPSTDEPSSKLTLLVGLLDHAVKVVPAAGYFWGVVAASATVAIISLLNGLSWLTFVAIVAAIVAMFIFYIFSRIEKSSDTVVKLAGYALLTAATLAFIFVIVTSAWLAMTCRPRLIAYIYGVSEVCYGLTTEPTPATPPATNNVLSPPARAAPAPYTGSTEFDGLSNADLVILVNKRTAELRSFEQGYRNRVHQIILSPPKGETSEQERANFQQISEQKEALEAEEQREFGKLMPETRSIYYAILKRRKEPYLGCVNLELATLICGQFSGEKPITDAADYLDGLAKGLSR